jgi:catechol 2,3-dioxygenase-like lactoylglutathione lyase family enzyme
MRAVVLFVLGILVGVIGTRPALVQGEPVQVDSIEGLNHVGMTVEDLDAAVRFYTETMGFRDAFSVRDDDGNTLFTYMQVNRDTFLELFPATAGRPPGFTHIAFNVDDLETTVNRLRQAEVEVDDPFIGRTNAFLTNAVGPEGVRIELLELSPGSAQREAVESWSR